MSTINTDENADKSPREPEVKQQPALNLENLVAEFRAAAAASGIEFVGEIIADGKRRRYRGTDDRRPVLWAKLHASGLGHFGSYRTGFTGTWRSDIKVRLKQEDKATRSADRCREE